MAPKSSLTSIVKSGTEGGRRLESYTLASFVTSGDSKEVN